MTTSHSKPSRCRDLARRTKGLAMLVLASFPLVSKGGLLRSEGFLADEVAEHDVSQHTEALQVVHRDGTRVASTEADRSAVLAGGLPGAQQERHSLGTELTESPWPAPLVTIPPEVGVRFGAHALSLTIALPFWVDIGPHANGRRPPWRLTSQPGFSLVLRAPLQSRPSSSFWIRWSAIRLWALTPSVSVGAGVSLLFPVGDPAVEGPSPGPALLVVLGKAGKNVLNISLHYETPLRGIAELALGMSLTPW